MSEKQVESGQEEPGAEELPKPKYSEPSADEPTSQAAGPDAKQIEELVRQEVDRRFQSGKDRRFNELEKQYGELSEFKSALDAVKNGADPEKIISSMEKKNLIQRIEALEKGGPSSSQPSPGKSEADEAFDKARALIEEAGLGNDVEVVKLMGGNYKNPAEMLFTVTEHVLKSQQQTPASPGGIVQPGGGGSSTKSDLDAEKKKEIAESVKGLSGQARVAKINEIESKYNRLKAERS